LLLVGCAGVEAARGSGLERAGALAEEGALAQAEDELSVVIAAGGEQSDAARIERGCLRVERGDAAGALDDLGALASPPTAAAICLGKAHALLAQHAEALAILGPLVGTREADQEVAELAMLSALSLQRIDEAAALGKKSASLYPSDARVMTLVARTMAAKGDAKAALATLEQCRSVDPESAEVPFVTANILWALERPDEAEKAYREALMLNPHFVEAARNLAVVLIQGGRYEEAEQQLRSALVLSPGDLKIMNNLGVVLASTGRLAEARDLYVAAAQVNPDEPTLQNNLVDIALKLGDIEGALSATTRLLELAPERVNAQRRHKELVAVKALVGLLCSEKKPALAAVDLLVASGWERKDAAETLDRALADPVLAKIVEERKCQEK